MSSKQLMHKQTTFPFVNSKELINEAFENNFLTPSVVKIVVYTYTIHTIYYMIMYISKDKLYMNYTNIIINQLVTFVYIISCKLNF